MLSTDVVGTAHKLEFGVYTRDENALPSASIAALLSRGFAHYLGNEQASKVVGKIRDELKNGGKAADVTTAQVKAYSEANKEQVATWREEAITAALAALDAGTVGVRTSSGPREATDPVGVQLRKLAKARVVALLQAGGHKFPGKAEVFTTPSGSFTGAELIARQIERHPEDRKKAERIVKMAQVEGGDGDEL